MLFHTALAVVAFVVAVVADDKKDLGTVLSGNKNLTKFYELIKKYPDVLLELPSDNGVTIVAPSDTAINKIQNTPLQSSWEPDNKEKTMPFLQYHIFNGVVSTAALKEGQTYYETTRLVNPTYTNVTTGQGVLINKQPDSVTFITGQGTRSTLVQADIPFTGGLIQVVDNILIPPTLISDTAIAFQAKSFLGALYAAKLMPEVAYRKNITVFAPKDDAYNLIGGGLQSLNASQLARIMNYHVIPDQVLSSNLLTNGSRLNTLANGSAGKAEQVVVRQAGNNKYIDTAQLVQPDILIANGIMHIVANVLNPDAQNDVPNPDIGTQVPVFPVSTVQGAFTSDLPCSTNCPTTTAGGGGASSTGTGKGTATTTSSLFSSSSRGGGARCTGVVGAVGMVGLGAGMAWI